MKDNSGLYIVAGGAVLLIAVYMLTKKPAQPQMVYVPTPTPTPTPTGSGSSTHDVWGDVITGAVDIFDILYQGGTFTGGTTPPSTSDNYGAGPYDYMNP